MSSGLRWGVLRALDCGLSAPAGRWSRPVALRPLPLPRCGSRVPVRGASGPGRSSMNVFDRRMKQRQKNWAASLEDGHQYDYLRAEVSGPARFGPVRPGRSAGRGDVTNMARL